MQMVKEVFDSTSRSDADSDKDDEDMLVLDKLCILSLHILIGIVNKLWKTLLYVVVQIEQFAKDLNLVKENYHSGEFEGNQCNAIFYCIFRSDA